MSTSESYPRDLKGYGRTPPQADWPGGAKIAVQFVLNYEEGSENSILHGDAASECFLSEMIGTPALEGVRHMSMESLFEYGSRVGVWRVLDLFKRYQLPLTVFGARCATGVRAPVRPTCTVMSVTSVSTWRAAYLKAIAHRGALAVKPSRRCCAMLSILSTTPSIS